MTLRPILNCNFIYQGETTNQKAALIHQLLTKCGIFSSNLKEQIAVGINLSYKFQHISYFDIKGAYDVIDHNLLLNISNSVLYTQLTCDDQIESASFRFHHSFQTISEISQYSRLTIAQIVTDFITKQYYIHEDKYYHLLTGIPQGASVSPQLCNLYFGFVLQHNYMLFLKSQLLLVNLKFCRYVDDISIFSNDQFVGETFIGFISQTQQLQFSKESNFCGINLETGNPDSARSRPMTQNVNNISWQRKLFEQRIMMRLQQFFRSMSLKTPMEDYILQFENFVDANLQMAELFCNRQLLLNIMKLFARSIRRISNYYGRSETTKIQLVRTVLARFKFDPNCRAELRRIDKYLAKLKESETMKQ